MNALLAVASRPMTSNQERSEHRAKSLTAYELKFFAGRRCPE
jgi:hypothetical protein